MEEKSHTLNHAPAKRRRQAVLGVRAEGGLIGAAFAHQGDKVTLLSRPEAYTQYPRHLSVDRPSGNINVSLRHATELNEPVDVLWVAVKVHEFVAALRAVPADGSAIAAIVPLWNGIDHVAVLRSLFNHERVIPGTIAVESEPVATQSHHSAFSIRPVGILCGRRTTPGEALPHTFVMRACPVNFKRTKKTGSGASLRSLRRLLLQVRTPTKL